MSPLRTLLRKELLDVVRDRRTLATTLLLPVLLYPGVFLALGVVIAAGELKLKNEPLVVATVGEATAQLLARRPPPAKTSYRPATRAEGEALLREKTVAAVVEAPGDAARALAGTGQAVVTVLYTRRFDRSMEALERLKPVLESLGDEVLRARLEVRQLDEAFVKPVKTDAVDLDFQKDLGPLVASRMLPLLLLMMLVVGALYPAVDLTAGEKERGTLETLLVAAVRPVDVMLAKYLTVGLVAVVSALANLGAMVATFAFGVAVGGKATPLTVHLTAGQVGLMLLCLLPAALLVGGLSLAISATARTFKEGQSLMTPVMLVCLGPGLLAQMPGIELSWATALVPLLNVALLVKAAVLGTATPGPVLITVLSVLLFAALALGLAAAAFRSEHFRFGGTEGWGAVFRRRRGP